MAQTVPSVPTNRNQNRKGSLCPSRHLNTAPSLDGFDRGEAEQGDPECDSRARQKGSSTGSRGNRATSLVFSIPTRTISICLKRTCALRRLGGSRLGRHWTR